MKPQKQFSLLFLLFFFGTLVIAGQNIIANPSTSPEKLTNSPAELTSADVQWHSRDSYGVTGSAIDIAVGDANNDGYNDMVCADQSKIAIFLWSPAGAGGFLPRIERSVSPSASGVSIGDANNDGKNDIAVANEFGNSVGIFLWNSTLDSWDPVIYRGVGTGPLKVVVADANNDGQNDITTANSWINNMSVLIWNISSQNWDNPINLTAGADGLEGKVTSVSVADVNNDGQNDIVTCSPATNTAAVLLWNTSFSTWDSYFNLTVGQSPREVVVGDANNDGQNDIVAVNHGNETISIILWNSTSWTWDPQIQKPAGPGAISVAIGDITNDGLNDIYPVGDPITPPFNGSAYVWNKNTKDWDTITHELYGFHNDVVIGDANNDGQNDIVAAYWTYAGVTTQYTDAGDWDPLTSKSAGASAVFVGVGDANNDGYSDIVTANRDEMTISILLWNPNSWDWDAPIVKPSGNGPTDISIGDANNDGQNDVVVATYNDMELWVYLWNRTYNDWNITEITISDIDNKAVVIADANNDGQNDIVLTGGHISANGNVTILLWNTTNNNWSQEIKQSVGFLPYRLAVSDVNNDGQNDILTADLFNRTISILLWNTTLKDWNPRTTLNITGELFDFAVGDVNIDGYRDIVVSNYIWQMDDVINIFLWNETAGGWDTPLSKMISGDVRGMVVGDVNNDGKNEMLTYATIDQYVHIFTWNTISTDWDHRALRLSTSLAPSDAAIGDVNNDGQIDIVLISNSHSIYLLLWNLNIIPGDGGIPGFGVSFALIGLLALTIIALNARRENKL